VPDPAAMHISMQMLVARHRSTRYNGKAECLACWPLLRAGRHRNSCLSAAHCMTRLLTHAFYRPTAQIFTARSPT
jgi:hypothetical protein